MWMVLGGKKKKEPDTLEEYVDNMMYGDCASESEIDDSVQSDGPDDPSHELPRYYQW